jgi:hypothetical protein
MSIMLNEPVINVVKTPSPFLGHDPVRLRRREDGHVEVAIKTTASARRACGRARSATVLFIYEAG